jgi:hypothetical protein
MVSPWSHPQWATGNPLVTHVRLSKARERLCKISSMLGIGIVDGRMVKKMRLEWLEPKQEAGGKDGAKASQARPPGPSDLALSFWLACSPSRTRGALICVVFYAGRLGRTPAAVPSKSTVLTRRARTLIVELAGQNRILLGRCQSHWSGLGEQLSSQAQSRQLTYSSDLFSPP